MTATLTQLQRKDGDWLFSEEAKVHYDKTVANLVLIAEKKLDYATVSQVIHATGLAFIRTGSLQGIEEKHKKHNGVLGSGMVLHFFHEDAIIKSLRDFSGVMSLKDLHTAIAKEIASLNKAVVHPLASLFITYAEHEKTEKRDNGLLFAECLLDLPD